MSHLDKLTPKQRFNTLGAVTKLSIPRFQSVVPLSVVFLGMDIEGGHLGFGDFDALGIGSFVEASSDF